MKFSNGIILTMKYIFISVLLIIIACNHKENKKENLNLFPVYFENHKYGFINGNGDTIIKPIYDNAGFFEHEMSIIGIKEKYGIINKQNKIIVKPIYDYLGIFTKDLLIGMIKHQTYLLDLKKDTIYHYNYETAGLWNNKTFVMVDSNNHIILLNLDNMKLIKTEFDDIILPRKAFYYGQINFSNIYLRFSNMEISNEYGIIVSKNKVGYIKYTGEVIAEPKYDYVYFFQNKRGIVKFNNKWGIIDNSGNEIVKPKYNGIFYELIIDKDKKNDISLAIKSDNFMLERSFKQTISFHEGLTRVKLNNKWGFIDTSGKEVIKPIYDYVFDFSDGYAIVKQNGKFGCIDKTGKKIIPCNYKELNSFYHGLSKFEDKKKFGFINIKGEKVLGLYDKAEEFTYKHSIVKINDKYGIIDTLGKFIVEPKYDKIFGFFKDLFESKNYFYYIFLNDKMGYMDKNCKIIFEANKYNSINFYQNGVFVVTQNNKDGIVDSLGREILSPQYERIYDFYYGISQIDKNGKRYYINKKGKIIFGPITNIGRNPDLSLYLNHSYLVDYPK